MENFHFDFMYDTQKELKYQARLYLYRAETMLVLQINYILREIHVKLLFCSALISDSCIWTEFQKSSNKENQSHLLINVDMLRLMKIV
jgi:hypothetical protein